jgi:hypothetical protein
MEFKNKDEERNWNLIRFGIYATNEELEDSLPGALITFAITIVVFAIFYFLLK